MKFLTHMALLQLKESQGDERLLRKKQLSFNNKTYNGARIPHPGTVTTLH